MNLLVTNDDGWGAPGLNVLTEVAQQLGDVWVVAPQQPMSGISHQLTFEVPMHFTERQPKSFSLEGTPADCVRVAMSQLGVSFDWVLSGVNQGANLGVDIYVSGTVAAAREATYFGCRSIALSQYLNGFRHDFDWSLTKQLAHRLLPQLLDGDLEAGSFINVNFPDTLGQPVDGVQAIETRFNRHPLPVSYESLEHQRVMYNGKYQHRKHDADTDIAVCFGGDIAVTRHFPNG